MLQQKPADIFLKNQSHWRRVFSRKAEIEHSIRCLFSPLNIYLWIHGIGFDRSTRYARRYSIKMAISIILLAVAEGNHALIVYRFAVDLFTANQEALKNIVLLLSLVFLNFILRYLFFTRRQQLNDITQKLATIYSQVSSNRKIIFKCRVKFISMLLFSDIIFIIYVSLFFYVHADEYSNEELRYGHIKSPYAVPMIIAVSLVWFWSYIHVAASAQFYSVCLVLKETLQAFKWKLCNSAESELQILSQFYCHITASVLEINKYLHPHVLTTLAYLLVRSFAQLYALMISTEKILWVHLFDTIICLSYILIICFSASSVVNADAEIKLIIQMLSVNQHSTPNTAVFLQSMREAFVGFKILDSIVIDTSFIFTAVGSLLTYGVLLATFSITKT